MNPGGGDGVGFRFSVAVADDLRPARHELLSVTGQFRDTTCRIAGIALEGKRRKQPLKQQLKERLIEFFDPNPDFSPETRALACSLFPQDIFLSRK